MLMATSTILVDRENTPVVSPPESYSVIHILEDGCFLGRDEVERLLERLRTKKNLILQGPPGTGKTWIAQASRVRSDGREGREQDPHGPVPPKSIL